MHLTASPSYGGPERQMLELGRELQGRYRSVYVTFLEEGRCWDFVKQAQAWGFPALALRHDTPRLVAAYRELLSTLRAVGATILVCHGYKPGILGRMAARRLGLPVVAVSRGWTGETLRVRLFDRLDRLNLRWMDHVICVSEGQARKVDKAGVPLQKLSVIPNAIRMERFAQPEIQYQEKLRALFPNPPQFIVGAAGRLSPEKGFEVLIDAAAEVIKDCPEVGFVLFGEGALRESLAERITRKRLEGAFVLAGFRSDLDQYLPHLDLLALPSFTEGLPNVVLEAFASGAPVVATAVGGVPEVVEHGENGFCVDPGDPEGLASGILGVLGDDGLRRTMGENGRRRVAEEFTFDAQARQYQQLFEGPLAQCRN